LQTLCDYVKKRKLNIIIEHITDHLNRPGDIENLDGIPQTDLKKL